MSVRLRARSRLRLAAFRRPQSVAQDCGTAGRGDRPDAAALDAFVARNGLYPRASRMNSSRRWHHSYVRLEEIAQREADVSSAAAARTGLPLERPHQRREHVHQRRGMGSRLGQRFRPLSGQRGELARGRGPGCIDRRPWRRPPGDARLPRHRHRSSGQAVTDRDGKRDAHGRSGHRRRPSFAARAGTDRVHAGASGKDAGRARPAAGSSTTSSLSHSTARTSSTRMCACSGIPTAPRPPPIISGRSGGRDRGLFRRQARGRA